VGEEVSGNYFSGLGVSMAKGSALSLLDESDHSAKVVISYSFWTEAFSRDPAALGQTLHIKGIPFNIVGVTAPSFFGVDPGSVVDFWIPLQTRPELNAWGSPGDRGTLYNSPKWWALPMIARLAPGVSPEQAQQALQPVFWQSASIGVGTLDPKRWPAHLGFSPIKGIATYAKSYREPVEIMMALVGLVLLIACMNVALLILARNAKRQREFAVRMATGARPSRILRQLLTESALLVSIGTALGWFLAFAFTRALAAWAKLEAGIAPDYTALFFTLGTASLVALVFSLAPFRRVFQISVEQALRSTNQSMSQSGRRVRGGNAAIAFQIGMCFTLLVAAGLTLRTLLNYENQDLGMRAENLLVFDVNPQHLTGSVQAGSFYNRLLDAIRAVPGVDAASLIQWRPGSGWLQSGGSCSMESNS
jgi:predicted permease